MIEFHARLMDIIGIMGMRSTSRMKLKLDHVSREYVINALTATLIFMDYLECSTKVLIA